MAQDFSISFTKVLTEELTKFKSQIISRLASDGTVLSKKTQDKIQIKVETGSATISVPFWFPVFERGRGPRKKTQDFKLWEIIKDWGLRHGVFDQRKNIDVQAKQLTWYINKYGTKLYRKGGGRNIYSELLPALVQTVKDRLLTEISAQINLEMMIMTKSA